MSEATGQHSRLAFRPGVAELLVAPWLRAFSDENAERSTRLRAQRLVSRVVNENGRVKVAGAGISMAPRLMDCGDAGHILLCKRVAHPR